MDIVINLRKKITEYFKKSGIHYYKTVGDIYWLPYHEDNTKKFRCVQSPKGWPSLFVFFDRRIILIDTKKDEAPIKPKQLYRFTKLKESGYQIYILRPKHLEVIRSRGKFCMKYLLEAMERF